MSHIQHINIDCNRLCQSLLSYWCTSPTSHQMNSMLLHQHRSTKVQFVELAELLHSLTVSPRLEITDPNCMIQSLINERTFEFLFCTQLQTRSFLSCCYCGVVLMLSLCRFFAKPLPCFNSCTWQLIQMVDYAAYCAREQSKVNIFIKYPQMWLK